MANRKPLVITGGRLANIPNGDALDLTGTDTYIVLDERLTPANPAAGSIAVYAETGALVVRDSAGNITTLGAGGGGGAQPAGQIVFGTGGGVTSDPDFTYVAASGQLWVNTNDGATTAVSTATPSNVSMFGADAIDQDAGGFSFISGSVVNANTDQLIGGRFDYIGGTGGNRTEVDTNIINGSAVGGQFAIETGIGGEAIITAATVLRNAASGTGAGIFLTTGAGSLAEITHTTPGSFGSIATAGRGGNVQIAAGTGGDATVIDDTTGVATAGDGGSITLEAGEGGIATADGVPTDGVGGSVELIAGVGNSEHGTINFIAAGDATPSISIDSNVGSMVFHTTTGSIFGISGNDVSGNLGVGGDLFIETGDSGTLAGGGGAMILLSGNAFEAGNGGVIQLFCQPGAGYPNAWGIVAFIDTPAVTPTTALGIGAGLYDFDATLDGVLYQLTVTATGTDTMQSMAVLMQIAVQAATPNQAEVVQAVSNVFKLFNSFADPEVGEAVLAPGTGGNPDLFAAIGTSLTATVEFFSNPVGLSGRGGEISLVGGEGATKEFAEGGTVSILAGRGGQGYNVTSISVTAATDTIVLPGYLVPSFVVGRSFTIFAGPNVGSYTTLTATFNGVNTIVVTDPPGPTTDSAGTDELVVQDDTFGGNVIIQAGQGNGNGSAGTVRIVGADAGVSVYGTPAPTYIAGGVTIAGGSVAVGASEAQGGSVIISGGAAASNVASDYNGGNVNINGGEGVNAGEGGNVGVVGGSGGNDGFGGNAVLSGGTGGGTTGAGGNVTVSGGGAGAVGAGGTLTLLGGNALGVAGFTGGSITITAGSSTTTAAGANISITGGVAVDNNGGNINITGGANDSNGTNSGSVFINTGTNLGTNGTGSVQIETADANGQAGAIILQVGTSGGSNSGSTLGLSAGDGGPTNGGGGQVSIFGGQGGGAGSDGNVVIGRGTTADRSGDHLYIPTVSTPPTQAPANIAGFAPIVVDTSNAGTDLTLWIYDFGGTAQWRSVTLT